MNTVIGIDLSAHGAKSAPSPQHVALANLFDEDRYDSLVEFSDRAISLWISIREAAWRREHTTLDIYCPKLRVLTLGAFETVKALSPEMVSE